MKYLIYCLTFWICLSCHKKKDNDLMDVVDPPVDSTLIWETFLAEGIFQNPIEFQDIIVWGITEFGNSGSSETYYAVDKKSGDIVWRSPNLPSVAASTYGVLACDNYVMVNHQTNLYVLDAVTGSLAWHYRPPTNSFFEPRMAVIDDQMYLTAVDASTGSRIEYIVRSSPDSPNWDTVFTYHGRNGFEPRLEVPALWVNEQGDSLLILQDRTSRSSPTKASQVDILAIDLKDGKMVWRLEDVSPTGNSAIYSPKVTGKNMILALDWWILSVDLESGTLNWIEEIGDAKNHLFTYELEIHNGRIYFNLEGDDSLVCLDLQTGETIWKRSGRFVVGYASKGLQYHNGRIYKGAWRHFNQICAVSPGSGDLQWIYECTTPDALTSDKIFIIEEQTNRMYISTGKSVISINLPK